MRTCRSLCMHNVRETAPLGMQHHHTLAEGRSKGTRKTGLTCTFKETRGISEARYLNVRRGTFCQVDHTDNGSTRMMLVMCALLHVGRQRGCIQVADLVRWLIRTCKDARRIESCTPGFEKNQLALEVATPKTSKTLTACQVVFPLWWQGLQYLCVSS